MDYPSGLNTIFLIGINSDKSYQICPIGVVIIDKSAPNTQQYLDNLSPKKRVLFMTEGDIREEYFTKFGVAKCNVQVKKKSFPAFKDDYFGNVNVSAICYYNDVAEITVSWIGDVDKIIVERENHDSWGLPASSKTVKLSNKISPYKFRYELNLSSGINYFKYKAIDKRGNESEGLVNVSYPKEDRQSSEPLIENNITIYN